MLSPRVPILVPRTPWDWGGGTWETIWHARSRGSSPRSPALPDPRSRRSTSPCPAGLGWSETLVLTTLVPFPNNRGLPPGLRSGLPGGLSF